MKADPLAVQTVASAISDTQHDDALAGAQSLRTYISNANLLVASMGLVASYTAQGGMSVEHADLFRHHLLRLLNLNTAVAEDHHFPTFDEEYETPEANSPFPDTVQ